MRILLLLLVALVAGSANAANKGDVLTIKLNDGRTVKGVLLAETDTGLVVKTDDGTQLVKWAEVADLASASALAPTITAPAVSNFAARVSFFSKHDDLKWNVTLGTSSCETPCTLSTEAGLTHVTAQASGWTVEKDVSLPKGESFVSLLPPGSTTVKQVGIGLMIGGGALLAGSSILFAAGYGKEWFRDSVSGMTSFTLVLMSLGAATLITGFIMWLASITNHGQISVSRRRPKLSEVLLPRLGSPIVVGAP